VPNVTKREMTREMRHEIGNATLPAFLELGRRLLWCSDFHTKDSRRIFLSEVMSYKQPGLRPAPTRYAN
jgi:hypothetical protein